MKVVNSKLAIAVMALLCVVCATAFSADGLVLHMRFDQGTINNGVATDLSGQGNNGLVTGDPQVVEGILGDALEFDGTDDVIEVPLQPSITFEQGDSFSVLAWIKTNATPSPQDGIVGNYRTSTAPFWMLIANEAGKGTGATMYVRDVGRAHSTVIDSPDPINTDTWLHLAGVRDQQEKKLRLFVNGELVGEKDDETENINSGQSIWIGDHLNRYYDGLMDDVRIYNHVLGESEILAAMEGAGTVYPYALGPVPKDGALLEDTWVSMGWSSGDFAASHDVYIGDNFNDVNTGAEGTFQGNQIDTFFVVGFPGFAYPDGLVPGTTYYWRIDEVNDTEPNSPWKGKIWSFSIPPKTAYNPVPADGAPSVDPEGDLSWTGGFGSKLHTVYFGETFDEVDNATGGLAQGTVTYTPSPLKMAKTYYWRVDEFDAVTTYKGSVWSFITQGAVESPDPANGAVDVTQTPVLSWVPGVFGASHEVYFGTDAASLELKGSGNLGSEGYDPGELEWDTTYYWRIDEANNANADSPWTGPLWSFTTANFLIIDDMESYNDIAEGEPGSNRMYLAWIDGYDDPTNGSFVGNDPPPIAELTIVHSGNQSMPMTYDNAVGKSEATLTLTDKRDWTVNDVDTLTIWFRGDGANAPEQLYVALNGNARVDHDNPDAAQAFAWTEWNIPLQAFADQGVNLTNVNSITLGLGSVTGGTGTMYFDDIRLYPPAP
jgi:hypothetical protein